MKDHIPSHVNEQRMTMFTESCDVVRSDLEQLLWDAEGSVARRVDELYIQISNDYRSALAGGEYRPGNEAPKWHHDMRMRIPRPLGSMTPILDVHGQVLGSFGHASDPRPQDRIGLLGENEGLRLTARDRAAANTSEEHHASYQ